MSSSLNNSKKSLLKKLRSNRLIANEKVLNAFKAVDREFFIPSSLRRQAYVDAPLSIGYQQTISQPSTVFTMVEALQIKTTDKILEIGSGSGYESAILAQLSQQVYSIEIVPELVNLANKNLNRAKIDNVKVIQGDGGFGCQQYASYDKIIISAACGEVPTALIEQLKDNGILIAPVGDFANQRMTKLIKQNNKLKQVQLGHYIFVPLTGVFGQNTHQ